MHSLVICYNFQIKAGKYAVCVTVNVFYMIGFCRDFVDLWALDCLFISIGDLVLDGEGTASNLAGGSLNVHPGLSLITSVFICTLPAWPMRACAFCLCCSGFLIVGIESISISILNLFLVSIGGFGVDFFSFAFDLEVDLCLLFVVSVSFLLVGFVVSFSVGLSLVFIYFFFIKSLLEFYESVLMWVVVSSASSMVVSTGSSMSIGLNLLDTGIGSFITVFYLVWIFFLSLDFSWFWLSHICLELLKCVPWLSLL